jgi:nifR3 family TIM-barrel protein
MTTDSKRWFDFKNWLRQLFGFRQEINFGFWKQFQGKKIMVLAPMADVTDIVFRQMFVKYGKPDVLWTEFVSSDGLCSPGREVLLKDLKFNENERPIVAQLFSSNPKNMYQSARMCRDLGFDGVDINMGCPDKSVANKQGAGSAMIRTPKLARKIIKAAQRGAWPIPVTVKTRIGYNAVEIESWLPEVLSCNIPALSIHLRTKKELSLVPAHWEFTARIRDVFMKSNKDTLFIANGDIETLVDAKERLEKNPIDGVMIGRGIFGNPWFFSGHIPVTEEKLRVLIEHVQMFERELGGIKNFAIMKKHFKAYVNGFSGAKELRVELMETKNAIEVEKIITEFLLSNNSNENKNI